MNISVSGCQHKWIVIDINYGTLTTNLICTLCDEEDTLHIEDHNVIQALLDNLDNKNLSLLINTFNYNKISDSNKNLSNLSEGEWKKILFESNQNGEILNQILHRHNWQYTSIQRSKHFDLFRYILTCQDGEDCERLILLVNLTEGAKFLKLIRNL